VLDQTARRAFAVAAGAAGLRHIGAEDDLDLVRRPAGEIVVDELHGAGDPGRQRIVRDAADDAPSVRASPGGPGARAKDGRSGQEGEDGDPGVAAPLVIIERLPEHVVRSSTTMLPRVGAHGVQEAFIGQSLVSPNSPVS
jgi:hypothetical protein